MKPKRKRTGTNLIAVERQRQIHKEKYNKEHDAEHTNGELAIAGSTYALPPRLRMFLLYKNAPMNWPWDEEYWKPVPNDRVKELVKAGALIAAEIDRLLRD